MSALTKYFIFFSLFGCASISQPEVFRLEQGETVICHRYAQRDCGMHLMECGESKSVEFECVKHVYYDRPNDLKEPVGPKKEDAAKAADCEKGVCK